MESLWVIAAYILGGPKRVLQHLPEVQTHGLKLDFVSCQEVFVC